MAINNTDELIKIEWSLEVNSEAQAKTKDYERSKRAC